METITHQLLAMEALCGFLCCVHEESVGHIHSALEGAVNPEWPATPELVRTGVSRGWVRDAITALQTRTVVWDSISTLLVIISFAA